MYKNTIKIRIILPPAFSGNVGSLREIRRVNWRRKHEHAKYNLYSIRQNQPMRPNRARGNLFGITINRDNLENPDKNAGIGRHTDWTYSMSL